MEHTYTLSLSRLPEISIEFKRINIFLGANGSGKSKVLQDLREKTQQFGSKPVIFIEGGRAITITDSLSLDNHNFQQFTSIDEAKTKHKNRSKHTLTERLRDALLLINVLGKEVQLEHSKAVRQWQKDGSNGSCPECQEPPLERLFSLFMEIFPAITLSFNEGIQSLSCRKNGQVYNPSQLSDGEKQIFSLLADIVILGGDNRLIIADEPELNLNPGLANRFWDLVENELGDSVFIYGSHSVSFAMRANVEKIFVLSSQNENVAEIKNIGEINSADLPALLGSIPAILSATRAIAVEGRENSLDTIIYRWLAVPKDVEIVAVGGCEDVQAVANKTGIWDTLAPSVQIVGIIDKDYKQENLLKSLDKGNCKILDYHEIESYLCHPNVVVQVANGIGSMEPIPTEQDIINVITEEFKKEIIQIVARRVFARSTLRLGVSIEKNLLKNIVDATTLEETLVKAAEDEVLKASIGLSAEVVKKIAKEEIDVCNKAVEDNSVDEMLRLMPGKGLLNKLASIAGCKNDATFARAATKHVNIELVMKLKELKEKLNT